MEQWHFKVGIFPLSTEKGALRRNSINFWTEYFDKIPNFLRFWIRSHRFCYWYRLAFSICFPIRNLYPKPFRNSCLIPILRMDFRFWHVSFKKRSVTYTLCSVPQNLLIFRFLGKNSKLWNSRESSSKQFLTWTQHKRTNSISFLLNRTKTICAAWTYAIFFSKFFRA